MLVLVLVVQGDTRSVAAQQLYEFEAYQRGQNVHMLGMPTQAEKLSPPPALLPLACVVSAVGCAQLCSS